MDMEDREICGGSINRRITPITTVLSHLYDEEETDFAPPKVKQYKESVGRPYYFTQDEVDKLCSITNISLSELIRFAACTGGRMTELLTIQAKDVDLEKNCLYFGGRPGFNTKNGDWRVLPIAEPIQQIVKIVSLVHILTVTSSVMNGAMVSQFYGISRKLLET